MTIKAIVELKVNPDQYDEFRQALDEFHSIRQNFPGFIGVTRYELLDDRYTIIEVEEWINRETRQAWLENVSLTGSLSRVVNTLRESFNAVTVKKIL